MKDDTIVVKIKFYDHELRREQVVYGDVKAIKIDRFETNDDSWITLTDSYRSLIIPKIDVIRISEFKGGEVKYIKGKELGDFSNIFSKIFILNDDGELIGKTDSNTQLDRAFRIIHNLDIGEYALIEISQDNFISNPIGWSDGVNGGDGNLIRDALFTNIDGSLLSSIFFNPASNEFKLRDENEFFKDILDNNFIGALGEEYGIRLTLSFSKTELNSHLNTLFNLNLMNPVFAPVQSVLHYNLPDFPNYFKSLDSENLLKFPRNSKLTLAKSKKTTFIPFNKDKLKSPLSSEQFFKAYLNLFGFKEVINPPGAKSKKERVPNTYLINLLGSLNIRYNPKSGNIDSNSERSINDIEGIVNRVFKDEDGMKTFLFLKEVSGEIKAVHKNDYTNINPSTGEPYVSTMKQWLSLLFDKIANIPDSELGSDRISELLRKARDNLRKLRENPSDPNENPLDVSHIQDKHNERDFSSTEVFKGKDIFKIISRLIGHVNLRFIQFHMVDFYSGPINMPFKLDFTTRRNYGEIESYLDQFNIRSPNQLKLETSLGSLATQTHLHIFSLFFSNAYMYLPIESGEFTENNKLEFGYSPLPFLISSFESFDLDLDIQNTFISQYKSYFNELFSQQGVRAKLKLFTESGSEVIKVLKKELNKHFSAPYLTKSQKESLLLELLNEAVEEIFKVGDNRISREGVRYPNLRMQIEQLLIGKDFSKTITFHKVLIDLLDKDGNPVLDESGAPVKVPFEIQLNKDIFRGYNVMIFRTIKNLDQDDVDRLLDS